MQGLQDMKIIKQIRPDHVATYIRWSTEEQGEGTTEAEQRESCDAYVVSQGWRVNPALGFVDAGYSGGSLNRPAMTRLRALIAAGEVDCVVAMKVDRLSRAVRDIVPLVLEEWEGRSYFRCAREPIDTMSQVGKFSFYLLSAFAEWERETIRERTFGGKVRRAREGKHLAMPPFGYRLLPDRDGEYGGRDIMPAEVAAVRQIFAMAAQGYGCRRIAGWLNDQGFKTHRGVTFGNVSVRHILQNRAYLGVVEYGRVRHNPAYRRGQDGQPMWIKADNPISVEGGLPAIVTEEEFQAAQVALTQRAEEHVRSPGNMTRVAGFNRAVSSDYLLTGILYSRCLTETGQQMRMAGRHRPKTKGRNGYTIYFCNGYQKKRGHRCGCGFIPCELVDDAVLREFFARFGDPARRAIEVEAAIAAEVGANTGALGVRRADVDRRQRDAERRVERLRRDYSAGELSGRLFEAEMLRVEAEQAELAAEAAEVAGALARAKASGARQEAVMQQLAGADQWEALSQGDRKALLRAGIERVTVWREPDKTVRVHVKFQGGQ